jgi:hypothetical protein
LLKEISHKVTRKWLEFFQPFSFGPIGRDAASKLFKALAGNLLLILFTGLAWFSYKKLMLPKTSDLPLWPWPPSITGTSFAAREH